MSFRKVATATVGIIVLVVAVAGLNYSTDDKSDAADCPPYLQGNTSIPCWYLGTKCYCFSSFRLPTWMRSAQYCNSANMSLLALETEEEDMMINRHVQDTPELNFAEYWTSGRYSQEGNNRWEWANAATFQPMVYTNWHPGFNQPDFNEPGMCALLYFLDYSGYWADNECIYSTRLICESIN